MNENRSPGLTVRRLAVLVRRSSAGPGRTFVVHMRGVVRTVRVGRRRDATLAALRSSPTDVGVATILIRSRAPCAIDASLQVIVRSRLHEPAGRVDRKDGHACREDVCHGRLLGGRGAVVGDGDRVGERLPGPRVRVVDGLHDREVSVGAAATARSGVIEACALASWGRAIGSLAVAVAVFCTLAPAAEAATSAVIVTTAAPPTATVPS